MAAPRPSPRSVLLLVNRAKPEVCASVGEVRGLIESGGGRLAAELDANGAAITPDAASGADLIVVLGGDGTLMGQSRRCVGLGLPLLGVNLGKLGFMAEFDLPSLRTQARDLFGGAQLQIQDRPMLRVEVAPGNDHAPHPKPETRNPKPEPPSSLALNDAVVTAGPPYRMISLSIRIDGQQGPSVTGDGLIVSTPIGSTAYNVSAGGPIISPDVDAMALTPLAAHSLSFRPVLVSGRSEIELHLDRVNDAPDRGEAGTSLVLDGQITSPLRSGQRVTIRQHDQRVRFVRNPQSHYWQTLMTKMRWAAPPAVRTR